MLVNVVDVPPLCNFIMPAIVRVGPISIAVSTRGASPALAKRLRTEIAGAIREPYAQLAEMLNEIRGWAATRCRPIRTASASSRTSCTRARPSSSCARATRGRPRSIRGSVHAARAPLPEPEGRVLHRERRERSFGAAFPMFRERSRARVRRRPGRPPRERHCVPERRAGSEPVLLVARRWATRAAGSPGSRLPRNGRCTAGAPRYAATSVRPEGGAETVGAGYRRRRARETPGIEAEEWAVERRAGAPPPAWVSCAPAACWCGRRVARGRRGAGGADRASEAACAGRRGAAARGARARRLSDWTATHAFATRPTAARTASA